LQSNEQALIFFIAGYEMKRLRDVTDPNLGALSWFEWIRSEIAKLPSRVCTPNKILLQLKNVENVFIYAYRGSLPDVDGAVRDGLIDINLKTLIARGRHVDEFSDFYNCDLDKYEWLKDFFKLEDLPVRLVYHNNELLMQSVFRVHGRLHYTSVIFGSDEARRDLWRQIEHQVSTNRRRYGGYSRVYRRDPDGGVRSLLWR
jgi:hypothetical protein